MNNEPSVWNEPFTSGSICLGLTSCGHGFSAGLVQTEYCSIWIRSIHLCLDSCSKAGDMLGFFLGLCWSQIIYVACVCAPHKLPIRENDITEVRRVYSSMFITAHSVSVMWTIANHLIFLPPSVSLLSCLNNSHTSIIHHHHYHSAFPMLSQLATRILTLHATQYPNIFHVRIWISEFIIKIW